jgi:hypothetical protein
VYKPMPHSMPILWIIKLCQDYLAQENTIASCYDCFCHRNMNVHHHCQKNFSSHCQKKISQEQRHNARRLYLLGVSMVRCTQKGIIFWQFSLQHIFYVFLNIWKRFCDKIMQLKMDDILNFHYVVKLMYIWTMQWLIGIHF